MAKMRLNNYSDRIRFRLCSLITCVTIENTSGTGDEKFAFQRLRLFYSKIQLLVE